MDAITLETQDDRFLISIGRDYLDKDTITRLIDRIKLEHLVMKADFDQSIEDMGERIKADWWANNKDRYLRGEA
jgi:hypothetical protein